MGFISIQEASDRTGKSQPTITRLARKNERTKHIQRKDRKFFIDEEFLFTHYPEAINHDESLTNRKESTINHDESSSTEAEKQEPYAVKLIERLEDENNYLKKQIEKKDQQIANFQDRQKELHYLLNHQTKLLESIRSQDPGPVTGEQSPPAGEQSKTESDTPTREEKVTESDTHRKVTNSSTFNSTFAIWIALAAITVLLLLAILFREPLRTWLDS